MRLLVSLLSLAYVMWLPVSQTPVLVSVLAVLAITGLLPWQHPAPWFATAWFIATLAVILMALVGSQRNAPGVLQQLFLWSGSLVIWGAWANGLTRATVRRSLSVIATLTAVLSGTIILYVASQQGILPAVIPSPLLEMQGAGFDATAAGSAIRFYGMSTLVAAGPLVMAGAVARQDDLLPSRRLLITAAVLATIAAAVAGRRALLVTTLLGPVLYLIIIRLLNKRADTFRVPIGVVLAAPMLFIAGVLAWGAAIVERARAALADVLYVYVGLGQGSGVKAGGDALRVEQSERLFAGWSEAPLFGSGLGGTLSNYQRNAESPWMFELQYHQLLFNGGLAGALLLLASAVILAAAVTTTARAFPEHAPTLAVTAVAAVGMLLANASNPYLQAIGHGWSVALVLGVANALSRSETETYGSAPEAPTAGTHQTPSPRS